MNKRPIVLGLALGMASSGGCASNDGVWTSSFLGQGFDGGGSDAGSSPDPFDGSSGADAGFSAIRPTFPPTTVAAVRPPPISGGTLLVTTDGALAIAADPDRDLVYGIDLAHQKVTFTVSLRSGDEPGRLAEDGAGRVHVALRGGGALVTIEESTGSVLARRAVCPAPRGVAWDATTDLVWVACATGELVALPSAGGAATKRITVERDLRDVIATGGALAVSEMRSAQVLRLSSAGAVQRRDQLPSPEGGFVPHVAWRAVAGAAGTIVALHQAESTTSLQTAVQGGYGGGGGPGGCDSPPPPPVGGLQLRLHPDLMPDAGPDAEDDGGADASLPGACLGDPDAGAGLSFDGGCSSSGAVLGVLTVLASDGSVVHTQPIPAAVPVDVAIARDGSRIAVVAPGNAYVASMPTVFVFDGCGSPRGQAQTTTEGASRQPIAVAFDASGEVLVQTREPASLWIFGKSSDVPSTILLSSISRADTGSDVFHTQAGAMIACASCHPEGRDDGHVWLLNDDRRRTPSLSGTVQGTAPYHWPGDEPDLTALVDDVYTVRMDGVPLDTPSMVALTGWVQSIPAPPAPSWIDKSAATRGKGLFEGAATCSGCHNGPKLTNSMTLDVGTGGAFQVPPLVGVGWRTPLLHDGCAATIADRLSGMCATATHGKTSGLSAQDLSDLTAYLESL